MRSVLFSAVVLTVLSASVAARADSTHTFTGVTTLDDGTVYGTITVDPAGGSITSINATYTNALFGSLTFTDATGPQGPFGAPGSGYIAFFDSTNGDQTNPGGGQLDLLLPPDSLVGFNGGPICSLIASCNGVESVVYFYDGTSNGQADLVLTGSLDSASTGTVSGTTPEPSTLVLLGTGALGLVGAARRRLIA